MSEKVYVTVGVDGRNVPAGGEKDQILAKASDNNYDFTWVSPGGGGGGTGGSPAESKSPKDTSNGRLGTSEDYARQDHAHPLNSPNSGYPEVDGTKSRGTSDYYALFDHVHPLNVDNTNPSVLGTAAPGSATTYARRDHVHQKPTASEIATTGGGTVQSDLTAATPVAINSISLPKEGWTSVTTDVWSQAVAINNGTAKTVVDLRPDYTTLTHMATVGTLAIYISNNGQTPPTFTAYAIGEKPTDDLTVSAVRVETA